ncbi:hypothetical protein [Dyella nitratireducens]|uniref:Uncharacterized protein n=1 Tax=Dyella nitratireducens TaxID=1849580 RepID=A0ABQ1GE15_9GAMM|nr:hypothetical protein [Dyella nitratireducens]GGA41903.1 hypothetical protein GCM10010981_33650 [Dyella nitratireducens]GLQ42079.1 hypothetical protein GCM10007902_19290 [Dyella nitratireducens]
MHFKTDRLGYLLACCALSLIAASYGEAASAAPVTGTAKVQLTHVFATLQTGQPDTKPEDTAACRKQVSAPDSRYFGITVSTSYSIDAKSLMMSASSTLPSPHATKPVVLTIPLSALGLAGQYAFGAFRPTALPDDYVLFSIGLDFKAAKSSVLVLNSDKDYNCLVTSDPSPFKGGLSTKLGADQK